MSIRTQKQKLILLASLCLLTAKSCNNKEAAKSHSLEVSQHGKSPVAPKPLVTTTSTSSTNNVNSTNSVKKAQEANEEKENNKNTEINVTKKGDDSADNQYTEGKSKPKGGLFSGLLKRNKIS